MSAWGWRSMHTVHPCSALAAYRPAQLPHLEQGDIIIDGGNSEYTDTNRRCAALAAKGILFVGSGAYSTWRLVFLFYSP